jgi:phage tail protein X
MSIYQSSRYINTGLYLKKGDTPIFGIRKRYNFDLVDAMFYTWIQGDTLDGLAYKQYGGNPHLWWAILDANPQYQSELDIKNGDVLVIPPYREVVKVSE